MVQYIYDAYIYDAYSAMQCNTVQYSAKQVQQYGTGPVMVGGR